MSHKLKPDIGTSSKAVRNQVLIKSRLIVFDGLMCPCLPMPTLGKRLALKMHRSKFSHTFTCSPSLAYPRHLRNHPYIHLYPAHLVLACYEAFILKNPVYALFKTAKFKCFFRSHVVPLAAESTAGSLKWKPTIRR